MENNSMDCRQEMKYLNWQLTSSEMNQDINRMPQWAKDERLGYCENAYQLKCSDKKEKVKNNWVRRGIAATLRKLAEAIYPQYLTEAVR